MTQPSPPGDSDVFSSSSSAAGVAAACTSSSKPSSSSSSSSSLAREPPARPKPAPSLDVSRTASASASATPPRLPRTSSLRPPPRAVVGVAGALEPPSTPPECAPDGSPVPHDAALLDLAAAASLDRPGSADDDVTLPLPLLPPVLALPPLDEDSEGRPSSLEVLPGGDASDRDTSGPSPDPIRPPTSESRSRMPHDGYLARSHSRSRSGKGSLDLARPKPAAASKPPSQKAMLSRALQKANTAVQLDNAQNFEGARIAYSEACDLLRHVLQRTSGDDDKRKLEAIRRTYASRIEELEQIVPLIGIDSNKALPARPGSQEYRASVDFEQVDDVHAIGVASTAGYAADDRMHSPVLRQADPSPRKRSVVRSLGSGSQDSLRTTSAGSQTAPLQSTFSRSPARLRSRDQPVRRLSETVPQPLATFRATSPARQNVDFAGEALLHERSLSSSSWGDPRDSGPLVRDGSQNSWLDPIDESGGSSGSSVHSRTSSRGYRRRHLRGASGNTELEFGTALDAAIEAAYDDGYEPMEPEHLDEPGDPNDDIVNSVLRKVEIARERVRQTEREAHDSEMRRRRQWQRPRYEIQEASEGFYDDNSSEEEERMLEEMTRGYGIEDFTMDPGRRPSASQPEPRGASAAAAAAAGQPLPEPPTAIAESKPPLMDKVAPRALPKNLVPSAPPPASSLPDLPTPRSSSSQSVRSRRLSGQNPRQLKIETAKARPPPPPPPPPPAKDAAPSHSRSSSTAEREAKTPAADAGPSAEAKQRQSPPTASLAPTDTAAVGSPPSSRGRADGDNALGRRSGSPIAHRLRKTFSSSSLRSMKSRNLSLSNIDDGSDKSPGTPSSSTQFSGVRMPAVPALPTPLGVVARENPDGSAAGGLHLFEDSFHMPMSPGTPNPMSLDAPIALEPCPNDYMLRPFWLMRCLYQTLVHPRGGYLSTKLFVPRDVWKVKGVKLKYLDDKVANCDFLTAALLKLAKVDTCDADAVLEEMQALEGVLEQVQATLTRKLGSEVGVQSSGVLFRDASNVVEADGTASMPRTASVSGKSSFSWRRLRSKNSAIGLGGAYNSKLSNTDGPKESVTLPTLPMTSQPTSRPARRDISQAQFSGPHAHYMGSLARLFDAAQAIDQIARQVEDPGLRHADKTQVGLELCTRHAAEFFGFYVCRFVLTDVSLLLDKFIKRGSEWVLS